LYYKLDTAAYLAPAFKWNERIGVLL